MIGWSGFNPNFFYPDYPNILLIKWKKELQKGNPFKLR